MELPRQVSPSKSGMKRFLIKFAGNVEIKSRLMQIMHFPSMTRLDLRTVPFFILTKFFQIMNPPVLGRRLMVDMPCIPRIMTLCTFWQQRHEKIDAGQGHIVSR
jgi:hypothetical protein